MSNEIAVPTNRPSLTEQKDFAVALAASDLLPKQYIGKPQNILVAMQWAEALGVAPMTAMQQLYILDGKPTASAQMIAGLVRRAGHNLRVGGDDQRAVCEITRSDDPDFVFKSVWTIERAQKSGLAGKAVWQQYPGAMLKARAITEAARDACPEALLGVAYTSDEIEPSEPRKATAHLIPGKVADGGYATAEPDPEPVVVADEDGVIVEEAEQETFDIGGEG